ncbi:MAG: TatD family hydrolase [Bacteroidales bacterium]|nr:TatD family hydrolase [Bacteroidales bacterium]MBR5782110.1 TatD family hydrolase [Bacteroidales bacterium]
MYIDTHSHIYDEAFDTDRELVFQRALDAGVEMVLLPNTDESTIKPMIDFYESHPDNCRMMMGLHPEGVKEDYKRHLSVIEKEMERQCWVGVGEIGLDLYWDKTFEKQQVEVLREQLSWAKQLRLPVSLHTREAFGLMFKVLEQEQDGGLRGVFHCFNGTKEQADIAMSLGFHLGLGGVITYKNCDVKSFLNEIPLDKILLETDDPYLPPVPYRGKRNEIAYMTEVAKKIAEVKQIDINEVATATTNNARQLFNL